MYGLPFREVWALDFEFIAEPGARPVPVCMVAKELRSGRLIRMWQDDFTADPPFDTGPNSLFIAYMAAAEIGCFLALGWEPPARVLDLYVEFRAETNGVGAPGGRGLLSALSYHGITGITADEKTAMRELVIRGEPWSDAERRDILAYCQTDVDPMAPLLERMLPHITARPHGLFYALLRGRYMTAVARMEWTGVPIDTDTLGRLLDGGWERIQRDLVAEIDTEYGLYDGTTFKPAFLSPIDRGCRCSCAVIVGQLADIQQRATSHAGLRQRRTVDSRQRCTRYRVRSPYLPPSRSDE